MLNLFQLHLIIKHFSIKYSSENDDGSIDIADDGDDVVVDDADDAGNDDGDDDGDDDDHLRNSN